MIKLTEILKEINENTYLVYHGTGENFRRFNLKNSTQGIIWFTSDKNKILSKEVGAQSHGYILTAEVEIKNPAGWDEYDNKSLGELKRDGHDGAILKDKDGFDCFVFSTSQIKIIKKERL